MHESLVFKSTFPSKPLLSSRQQGCDPDTYAVRELAAAILAQAFEDLACPCNTKRVYAAFFFSDYCKNLFAMSGVEYNADKIRERIEQRPKQRGYYYDTRQTYGIYNITVENGYITEIRNRFTGEICRLKAHTPRECNYYYPSAMSRLYGHTYTIVEGV